MTPFNFSAGLTSETMRSFFVHCYRQGVSDIHLQSGSPVIVGLHGRMVKCTSFGIDHPTLLHLIDGIFSPEVKASIQRGKGDDRSLQLEGDSHQRYGLVRGEKIRFRANFVQASIRGLSTAAGVTLRVINNSIPVITEMSLPDDLCNCLSNLPVEGIGLVVGPTGSGKSTLLSAIYQHHGRTNPHCKVVLYEDPVEALLGGTDWVLQPQQCEIGQDVPSFADGLRLSMRQAPTIIGIGEVRDGETVEGMVSAALSGHLCLATEHAFSPGHAFSRSVRMLPAENREPLAHDMLELMRFIVMQRLVPTTDGRRQAVQEYSIFDDTLRDTLREQPYTQWPTLLNDLLTQRNARISDRVWTLHNQGLVSDETAIKYIGLREFNHRNQGA